MALREDMEFSLSGRKRARDTKKPGKAGLSKRTEKRGEALRQGDGARTHITGTDGQKVQLDIRAIIMVTA
jgi:hypothetical protein